MKEEFLHYLWRYSLYRGDLLTTKGEAVSVIKPGWPNSDSGPDFFNAMVKVGDTIWAGNIEIHVNSSEWFVHKHQNDPAYDNVILHVVFYCDMDVTRRDSSFIPTLELKERIDLTLYSYYTKLLLSMNWIPCENQIEMVDKVKVNLWLERILIERFERKAALLENSFSIAGNNLEELLYHRLAAGFGLKVNSDAFVMLARSLPLKIISRHYQNPQFLEALLFGQAGMLEKNFSEKFPNELKEIYIYFKNKYKLISVPEHNWKYLRMRPVNFPTIRISQFAALLGKNNRSIQLFTEAGDVNQWRELLSVKCSKYWEEHYLFDKLSARSEKRLGHEGLNSIIINELIPYRFFTARRFGMVQEAEDVLQLLHELDFETNSITKNWLNLKLSAGSAYESQSLIELKHNYCDMKKCLDCSIGHNLLREQPALNVIGQFP